MWSRRRGTDADGPAEHLGQHRRAQSSAAAARFAGGFAFGRCVDRRHTRVHTHHDRSGG